MPAAGWMFAAATLLVASTAAGQASAPAPVAAPSPAPAPPPAMPGGPPPQPYGGTYTYPPPAYGYPPVNQNIFVYQSEKKTPLLALGLEFLFPGLGSVYGNDVRGALVTWGLAIGGVALLAWDLENEGSLVGGQRGNYSAAYVGFALLMVGRVYGLINSWSATEDYNVWLAQRLGLRVVGLSVQPIAAGSNLAWGPALSLAF